MSTNQPRGFNAATDVLAFMQVFTTESLGHRSEAVRRSRGGSRQLRSLLRRHLTTRSRGA
ncbi:MAG: hypothetical protein QOK15_1532 [Nocardioidaceae bacterium]|jgi:hypothetical protein|nr:hypothetical protein [Nocardioidaceae bacterium]